VPPKQALHLTGAAILVSRGVTVFQAEKKRCQESFP